MQAQRLKATYVVLILCVVLGSAVAVESMLTRGGQRLAAKAEEHAALYTDSDGKTWPLGTHAPENSGEREEIHHPDSVHAGDSKAAAGGHQSAKVFPSQELRFPEPVASRFIAIRSFWVNAAYFSLAFLLSLLSLLAPSSPSSFFPHPFDACVR